MSDIGEKVRFLIANSNMTHRAAELFIAEILEIGEGCVVCRERGIADLAAERASRSGGLYVVARDEGNKNAID